MNIVEIKNRYVVIDSDKMAKETLKDVLQYDAECTKSCSYLSIDLVFTEKAYEVFKEQAKKTGRNFSDTTRIAYPTTDPLFKDFQTELVLSVNIYAKRDTSASDVMSCTVKNAHQCVKTNGKYYCKWNACGKKGFCIMPAVPHRLSFAYSSMIEYPTRPNLVNVATQKKLDDWANYWDEVGELLEQKKLEIETKTKNFQNKLKKIVPDKFKERNGYVVKNGIKYSWKLDDHGYACEKVEVDFSTYKYDKMELFKMLSNNKFDPNKGLL